MTIEEHRPLASLTTIGVGGKARYFSEATEKEHLRELFQFARQQNVAVFVLGGGSNLVLPDQGFPGLVIRIAHPGIHWHTEKHELTAGAAILMSELVDATTEKGWAGLEWAGGLPGTLGGAVRGNAGAFGGEMKDSVVSVTTVDRLTGEERIWSTEECNFRYRTSAFKELIEPPIIWEVSLRFTPGNASELMTMRDEKITYRKTHHPQAPSVGSIFQNLWVCDLPADFFTQHPALKEKVKGEKLPAGSLLEAVNMKGERVGDAVVSQEHANIVINVGHATGRDVRELVEHMRSRVQEKFGITLHEEPEFVSESEIVNRE